MYKMVVMDLDDTLLSDDLTVCEDNLKALTKAKELGALIMFCSGRSDDSVMKVIDQAQIHDDDEYYISYNGARIDQVGGDNLYIKAIKREILNDLIDIGHEYGVVVQLYHEGKLVVEEENDLTKAYQTVTGTPLIVNNDLKSLPYSIKVLYHDLDIPKLNEMKEVVEKKYDGQVHVFFSKKNYLEVLDIEVNKGLAVKFMAEKFGIKQEEIIAIGDGNNDSYMIEYAGLGAAVKNGVDELKEIADYVTEKTNNDGAVAEVINKFILS